MKQSSLLAFLLIASLICGSFAADYTLGQEDETVLDSEARTLRSSFIKDDLYNENPLTCEAEDDVFVFTFQINTPPEGLKNVLIKSYYTVDEGKRYEVLSDKQEVSAGEETIDLVISFSKDYLYTLPLLDNSTEEYISKVFQLEYDVILTDDEVTAATYKVQVSIFIDRLTSAVLSTSAHALVVEICGEDSNCEIVRDIVSELKICEDENCTSFKSTDTEFLYGDEVVLLVELQDESDQENYTLDLEAITVVNGGVDVDWKESTKIVCETDNCVGRMKLIFAFSFIGDVEVKVYSILGEAKRRSLEDDDVDEYEFYEEEFIDEDFDQFAEGDLLEEFEDPAPLEEFEEPAPYKVIETSTHIGQVSYIDETESSANAIQIGMFLTVASILSLVF
jgi:hypothetical protein